MKTLDFLAKLATIVLASVTLWDFVERRRLR